MLIRNPIRSRRGIKVDGELIRTLRNNRKLTQEQLANKAGFSERLVRKAEMSGYLDCRSIELLAKALSGPTTTVVVSDLFWVDRGTIRADQVVSLLLSEIALNHSNQLDSLFSDSSVLDCTTAPSFVPFKGVFLGINRIQNWFSLFRQTLDSKQPDQPVKVLIEGAEGAFVQLQIAFHHRRYDALPIDLNIYMIFESSKVKSLTLIANTIPIIAQFNNSLRNRLSRVTNSAQ